MNSFRNSIPAEKPFIKITFDNPKEKFIIDRMLEMSGSINVKANVNVPQACIAVDKLCEMVMDHSESAQVILLALLENKVEEIRENLEEGNDND